MIFVMGYGQMCNNMLQLGHFYAWATENNKHVIGLRFCYKYLDFELSSYKGYNWLTYIYAKYAAKLNLVKTVDFANESDLNNENLTLLQTGNVVVKGWFLRDFELFLKHQETIRKMFSFKQSVTSSVNKFLENLRQPSQELKIGLHIRRGDYARWFKGIYFYSDDDYISFIKSFSKNKGISKFQIYISSNDAELNLDSFKKEFGSNNIVFMKGKPTQELYLLSLCDYILGPPSTFSLMAAFYQNKPLCWVYDKRAEIEEQSFKYFSHHFKHII